MKYKLYKKVEPLYLNFEKLLGNIILPLVIASYISYPVLYFFDIKIAILFNVFIALIANHFHKGLKNYLPVLQINNLKFGLNFSWFCYFIIILIVLLITNFGFYLLVLYQKNNEFNSYHFYFWFLILFGFPLLYYIIKSFQFYYIKKNHELDFADIVLAINHDSDFFLSIHNIQFLNTLNRKSSDIKITNNIRWYSQKEFISKKTKSRQYYANKEGFRELVQIPFNSNMLLLSWFSYVENKYYSIKIPFPFTKIIADQENSSADSFTAFRVKQILPLYLHFYLNGGIKFFYKDEIIIDYPFNNESEISEEDKKRFFFH
jgi:hypothetical protein